MERVEVKSLNCVWLGSTSPEYVENTDNSNLKKRKNIRQWVVCYKHRVHEEICFICKQYDQGLCAVPCLENCHSLKNYLT